ncbi:tetratricopeptide repeat protein [Pauljensenia sp. 20925_1_34]|uniref:tetratricopeptide repeat protein n=1 Tax=Pauljensenia sp. 20925_1_34 TaxID=3003674 RepID=UPI00352E43B2
MSTNRNVANLSITVVKTLVKMAGFGFAADMIDGAQECLNLLADIKNDALGDPNAEMIRGLNGAVKSELDAIENALNQNGMSRKQIKQAVAQLSDAARQTIKDLAEDDDALIRAVQQPERFAQELRAHAAPLPDLSGDEMQAHYETILDQIAEEFHTLAPWSPNFDRVALADLLRCFPALTDQVAQLERTMNVRFDNVDEGQRKIIKLLETRPAVAIKPVVFGSRPEVVTDDRFVKRDEHEQLNALVTDTTTRRTVLVGMRGCGKTQLAAALAIKCEEAKWNLVAWINAVSPDTIQSDLVELAKRLKIDTSDQPAQDVIVRRCLGHLGNAPAADRLIVFDNVEDINHLTGLIPSGDGVRVVATTTNKVGWEDQGWNSIKVGVFDRNTSIEYLLTVTKSDDHDAADALAERLGDLPLAIAQAAATARHKDLSLARYLKRLKSRGEELVIRPIPGDEYTDDVATVLWMAVEAAVDSMKNGTKQMARRQLGALALLAESGVPTRWLAPTKEQSGDQQNEGAEHSADEDAHDALTELISRSIVQQTARDRSKTTIHRLQAQVLRNSWNNNELDDARAAATSLLGSVNISRYPSNDTKARRQEALDLVDQLRSIGTQEHSQVLFESPQISEALFQAFSHASDLGLPYEALTLNVAVDALEGLLGPDHPDTLASRHNLAYAYQSAGRLGEAVILYEKLFSDRTRVLGEDHPDTFTSRNNLAYAYQSAGRLGEAVILYEKLFSDRTRILGPNHRDTLASCNNLAYAYESAGRLTDAIALYEDLLVNSVRILGPDHDEAFLSRINLAGAYMSAGFLTKAIPLYEEALADSVRILGPNHHATLLSRTDLAGAYMSAGRLAEAITLYQEVHTETKRIRGLINPVSYASSWRLQKAYKATDRLSETFPLFEEIHTDRTFILGPIDHIRLVSRNNLTTINTSAGRLRDLIPMFEKVLLDRQQRVLGPDHPDTLVLRNNLAYVYKSAGFLEDAITLYEQVLADSTRVLGENHPQTLASRINLTYTYRFAGHIVKAINLYEETIVDSTRILGPDHPQTLASRNNLAGAYASVGRLTEAIALYEQVHTDSTRVLGGDHPHTLTSRNNLAGAYLSAGRLTEAIALYEQVHTDSTRVLGEDHPHTLTSRNNLAYAYESAGRLQEAIGLFDRLLGGCLRILGPDHPLTATVRKSLEAARRELAEREESSPTEERGAQD